MSDASTSRIEIAERHRATAATFTARAKGVTNWDAPAPVAGWTARDVVRHLIDWSRELFSQGTGVTFGELPSVDVDPVRAWEEHTGQLQMLLENKALDAVQIGEGHFPRQPLAQAIGTYYVPDVFMHTWDLARASGQEHGLDQATAHRMLQGMEGQEAMLRASGQFGQRQPVAEGASSVEKLMAFVGRNPRWGLDEEDERV